VLNSVLARDGDRVVSTAIVDHQHLDGVDTRNLLGQIRKRDVQRLRLVEARDLNDELHVPGAAELSTRLAGRGVALL